MFYIVKSGRGKSPEGGKGARYGSGSRRSLENKNIIPKGFTIRARGASATLYSSLVLEVILAMYLQKRHQIEVEVEPLVEKVKWIQEQAVFKSVCEEIESSLASYSTFEESRWAEFNKLNAPIVQSLNDALAKFVEFD